MVPFMSEKNRPSWRARLGPGRRKGENIKLPVPMGDFSTAPRCKAHTRAGRPCKAPAMRGSNRCNKHGGHYLAYQSEIERLGADKVIVTRTGVSAPRKALAKLAAEKPTPPGLRWIKSPVERGKAIDAYENRDLDPQSWLEFTRKDV